MPMFDVHRIVDVSEDSDNCVPSPRTPYRILRSHGVPVMTTVYSIRAKDIDAARAIASLNETAQTSLRVVSNERPYFRDVLKGNTVVARLLVSPHAPSPRMP